MNKCKTAAIKDAASFVSLSISQDELERYCELKPLADEFSRLDRRLKDALEHGAPVEPGLLTIELHIRRQRRRLQRFLFRRLKLTRRQVEKLGDEAPLVAYRSLAVVPVTVLAQP